MNLTDMPKPPLDRGGGCARGADGEVSPTAASKPDRKITNTKKEKSEKETTYYITINIYDLKDAQEKECTTVNNLNQLNVKVDKKIPIFIKGKK